MSSLIELFVKGGPIMCPLLLLSVAALTVVIERLVFVFSDSRRRNAATMRVALQHAEHGRWNEAGRAVGDSSDAIAGVLRDGLAEREAALTGTLQRSAERELQRQARGLTWLDTCITADPLLGLLGTFTGMIRAFSLVGGKELGAPAAITGGIAEALIATSSGVGVAILALFPFNFLTARLKCFRHELQDACTALEIAAQKHPPASA